MNVISATRTKLVLRPSKKDENWKSFIFDIGIIPDKPTPQRVVIEKKVGAYLLLWSISWQKFLKQTCIDTIVILEKDTLTYKSVKQNGGDHGRGL
ncbi:MAG TPA: hypothetical protein VFU31_27835 [Candidatus Binatia bacterium]|nr:hypothetical protein [Candidatus Binatia bacterium]